MLDTVDDGNVDDIERELCSSAREASVGWVPFVNRDVASMMQRVAALRRERGQLIEQEVNHLLRFGYLERLSGDQAIVSRKSHEPG